MNTITRILITNDDGVDAPGIAVLREIASEISDDVWVVAPDGNQSGTGHRLTFGIELELQERAERVYALDGTPADCVIAGITHVLKDRRPDIVLAGVNRGQNLGDIIHCSGTVAGAREGALHGAVGIAMSQAMDYSTGRDEISWESARAYGAQTIRALIARARRGHSFFNVNFPDCPADAVSGIAVVPYQRFVRSPFELYPSRNAGKHFVAILDTPKPLDAGSDFHMLHSENAITVTPLLLQQTDQDFIDAIGGHLPLVR